MVRSLLLRVGCWAGMLVAAHGVGLEGLWQNQALWEHTPGSFQEAAQPWGFRWNSSAFDSSRAAGGELALGGVPVVEAVARFGEGKMTGLTITFYARGDSSEISKQQFEALLTQVSESLTKMSGVRPEVRGKDANNAVRADGILWQTPRTTLLLEYAMSRIVLPQGIKHRPEFIRLEMTPSKLKGDGSTAPTAGMDTKSRIVRSPNGDVRLQGVPMVNQGEKGYCVVASAERVLRYYGMKTDQNELAQLAGSDRMRGTSLTATLEALKQAGTRMHFRVKVVDDLEIREIEALLSDYNRKVSKYGKGLQIPPLKGTVDLNLLFATMQPDALREARLGQRAGMSRFMRSATRAIDEGQPLLWGVNLGLIREPGLPQAMGGHVRLLIGYNSAKNEVLYTDSWGAGHELKRMSLEDAWTMHAFSLLLTPW